MTNQGKLNELAERVECAIRNLDNDVECEDTALTWFKQHANHKESTARQALKIAQAAIKDMQSGCVVVPSEATGEMVVKMRNHYTNREFYYPDGQYGVALRYAPKSNTQKLFDEMGE